MSVSSVQGNLFGYDSFETIITRQNAEDRAERLDMLSADIGSLSLEQLVLVQQYVTELKVMEKSDG